MTDTLVQATPLPDLSLLCGSVKLYQRHLFLCTGHTNWPAKIDLDGGFAGTLAAAIAARADAMPLRVKFTACDEPSRGAGMDVLVFPDQVRYLGVTEADLPALVEDLLVRGQASTAIAHEPIGGQHVFVCVHGARDERCGACGPPLVARFQAELAARGLSGVVTVHRSSHVGGHSFAGNVLLYPSGDWYGYVTPEDAPEIIDEHLLGGRIVSRLWRGCMGLTPEEQLSAVRGV